MVLYFKATNTLNGDVWITTTKQVYPGGGAEGGLRVLVQTIDLAGWTANIVTGTLSCTPVVSDLAWWSKYIPELASSKITSFSVGAMTVLDESGSPVSLSTYPNVLDDGSSIAPWMQLSGGAAVVGKRVTITAIAVYIQNDAEGRAVENFVSKELCARVTVTNGITDSYTTGASSVSAEPIPPNLAQDVYTALNTLQYEGTFSAVQTEISGMPTVANVLNLTGGRTDWTTMNAMIQSVRRKWGNGRTEITIGPARHLSAADLTQLFLINRLRRVWVNPSAQATAQLATNGNVALGANAPKENTHAGLNERSQFAISFDLGSGNATMIFHDASAKQITLKDVSSSGAQLTGSSDVRIKLADLMPDSVARSASFQLFRFKDSADSCNPKKCYVLMTTPEPDP